MIGSRAGLGPELECTIVFNSLAKDNIELTTTGDDSVEVSETFAAIEEQIERTFTARLAPALSLVGGILIFVAALIWLTRFDPNPFFLEGLPRSDVIALDQKANAIHSNSEQMEFLFDVKRREIHSQAMQLKPADFAQSMTLPNVLNGLVVLLAALLLLYLGLICYPRAVFAWGDGGQRYDQLRGQRRMIRNAILMVIIGGIVVNLVASALWDRYKSSETHKSEVGNP